MTTIMLYLLALYLFINGTLVGYYGDDTSDPHWKKWLTSAIAALFAIPLLIICGCVDVVRYLDKFTQWRTYWMYLFNRKGMVVDEETLHHMNRRAVAWHASKSLRDRIYRHAIGLWNKVNNYKHEA